MFGTVDVFKFLISFFLILPVVTFIHLSGHIFLFPFLEGPKRKLLLDAVISCFPFGELK
jgi:hypothetical protein